MPIIANPILPGCFPDPSIFFDDDGRAWVHGTRLAANPQWHDQTEVWLRELDRERLALTGDEHILWNGALSGAVWAEGPHHYQVDGRYYLLASEGGTEFYHAISVARSDRVTGPYTGSRANPVLTHRQLGRDIDIAGVGHADLVQAADGSWWAMVLAMRPYGGYHVNLGREAFVIPISWHEQCTGTAEENTWRGGRSASNRCAGRTSATCCD